MRILNKEEVLRVDLLEGDYLVVDAVERFGSFAFGGGILVDESLAEIVLLTRVEKLLLEFLLLHRGVYIETEVIIEAVWGDPGSIPTLRNFIKKLRDLTFHGLIKNKSNYGYMIPKGV